MNNKTRLEKLKQAEALIREVEFSYPQGDPVRRQLYKVVVDTFSYCGSLDQVMAGLKQAIYQDKKGRPAKGTKQRECDFEAADFESCPECRAMLTSFADGEACPFCGVNLIDAYEKSNPV